MKNIFLLHSLLLSLSVGATETVVVSPNGDIKVTIGENTGNPVYSVNYKNIPFILKSPLGLKTNIGDFSKDMVLSDDVVRNSISERYSLANIKKSSVEYNANEIICSYTHLGNKIYDVIFRVSDNDIAFKYKMYPQDKTYCCNIEQEMTSYALPEGTTTFLCPQVKPMGGFARTYPSYETPYTSDAEICHNGWGEGYTFPCLFRNNDDGWVLISETGLDSGYCASRLIGNKDGSYTVGYPQEDENNGNGSASPAIALPGETPWRTITIGNTLAPIVETTIPFDVVQPLYKSAFEYNYTKGSWSWIIGMDASCNYEEQKRYIDFSSQMGYQTVLVDALWDTQIGKENIEALARYGSEKGVSLYLWYNSNGHWNDAPQGPRGLMSNTISRRREMSWMQRNGIKGIKVDFFGGDKQNTIKLYEDILTDANDYGLLVIFHGCTLPRGWERMYPNYASSEAVLASENLYFSQNSCDTEAYSATMHPFIRNAVGSMDFGGSALNKYYHKSNMPGKGNQRRTSDVFALAVSVLFQSPVQHFALAPNNLTDAPEWAIEFMKNVPTTWDDVKFIDGYPGKYIVLARRCGDKWFIAGINAQKETMKLAVNLPMLTEGTAVMYTDNEKLTGSVKTTKINKSKVVSLSIPCNGAVLITQ